MGSFDDDWDAVDGMMAEVFGDTVSIHRASESTSGVTAEALSREYEVIDTDGVVTVVNVRDFVINVEDYTFGGTVTDPRSGDRIKQSIAGTTHVFEVMPIASRPSREWVGNQNPQWMIHTKLVGTE